jgi:DNA-binding response OmpR family regulator
MTAYPEGQVREQALACGADDFLDKPFAIEKFRTRVATLLARRLGA